MSVVCFVAAPNPNGSVEIQGTTSSGGYPHLNIVHSPQGSTGIHRGHLGRQINLRRCWEESQVVPCQDAGVLECRWIFNLPVSVLGQFMIFPAALSSQLVWHGVIAIMVRTLNNNPRTACLQPQMGVIEYLRCIYGNHSSLEFLDLTQLFSGTLFPICLGGCPTKNGLPKKRLPLFPGFLNN